MADQEAEGEEEKKKSKLPLIIGLVVVLAGGGAGAYFSGMLGGGDDSAKDDAQAEDTSTAPAQYIAFKPDFVSNYVIDGRARYMKIVVSAMTRDDEVRVAINNHMPALRNQLVMLFGAADFTALKTAEGKTALRQSALEVCQEVMQKELGKPGIEQIFFTDFVLQ